MKHKNDALLRELFAEFKALREAKDYTSCVKLLQDCSKLDIYKNYDIIWHNLIAFWQQKVVVEE